ncbi:hypothetical protein ACP4OV_011218 [Aristida adscensionis]
MARGPRRLRNLNFEEQLADPVQEDHDDSAGSEENEEENLEGPPAIDNILAGLRPSGEVREFIGEFGVSNLFKLQGGKVVVGTDENGVPNERSASILGQYLGDLAESPTFAPLHIPRWDNELFQRPKVNIIKDVEGKILFPAETQQLTRDWILGIVNNRWRAYKSKLKKLYFNRQDRTPEEIIAAKPKTVNQHQWRALIGMWCQEKHKKNPHTTGRKSHARLKKEMEEKRKEKVHKLELWDAAHKKRDGSYANDKVKIVMELAKRKERKSGKLSAKDFDEVFDDVVAKESKPRGYYDAKHWSHVKVSQGLTFVAESELERRYKDALNPMEKKVQRMCCTMSRMHAFMVRKFPEDDWRDEMLAEEDDEVDYVERVGDNSIHYDDGDNSIYSFDDNAAANSHEESNLDVYSPGHNEQMTKRPRVQNDPSANEVHAQSFLGNENLTEKQACAEKHRQANKGFTSKGLPPETLSIQGRRRRARLNPSCKELVCKLRNEGKTVAKGELVSTHSTCTIFEEKLGANFYAVYVTVLENISRGNTGQDNLPRPFQQIIKVIDAIGYVIAWPWTHVKRTGKFI